MGQLHLVGKASNAVAAIHGKHHSFNSFSGSAWEVVVLRMLHLVIFFMMQYGQSFSCNVSHSSLEHPAHSGSLDHLANTVNMIGHRLLIDDHPHMSEIGVPMKQPQGSDKKRGSP
jgi:hypothetical protein